MSAHARHRGGHRAYPRQDSPRLLDTIGDRYEDEGSLCPPSTTAVSTHHVHDRADRSVPNGIASPSMRSALLLYQSEGDSD